MKPRLGSYELGALIGRGGVGQVHAARDPAGRGVVVKRLRDTLDPDPCMRQRLREEALVCRQVSHLNVVRTLEHDCDPDASPYIVMDHVDGITLDRLLEATGPLPMPRVRVLALQLFEGLGAIHDAGIVHADLTSGNIIIDEHDHLTIIDFGLARTKALQPAFDQALVAGTPEFMAPELFVGTSPSVASDIYAAGIVIYEMLAGTTPFDGESPARILHQQTMETVTFPPQTRELEGVLRRALARDAANRFQDVRGLATAFACVLLEDPRIRSWRDQLLEALVHPPVQPIIVAYCGLADALISGDRMLDALVELEDALELLMPATGLPPPELWRISLLLAALCGRLGMPARARELVTSAHDQATRADDRDAIERARWLLGRLAVSSEMLDADARARVRQ